MTRTHRNRTLLAAVATGLVAATAPASALAACAETDARPAFDGFGDDAQYTLAPGGDFESSGWELRNGARIVWGNETAGVTRGRSSLNLPLGSSATSPEFCVDEAHPHFRFMSRPSNALAGYEAIIEYRAEDGRSGETSFTSSSDQSWSPNRWAPSAKSPLATEIPGTENGGSVMARIRFEATGNLTAVGIRFWGRFAFGSIGTTQIDSVMVDPYRRG